ncbi:MAG: PSD1 and planctomycete cytochrome C domain-containing protein [Planctomycetota bacterium]|nr:PSD1 and planctomycete cytochrome C domain-containing protein [Planctomycetota bacterium]
MKRFTLLNLVLLVLLPMATSGDDKISFSRDIQPLFSERCFDCHGPDKSEGGLRLHLREKAVAELESGDFAIVPGKLNASTLLERIVSQDESDRMPPDGERLTPLEVEKIRRWIAQGAEFDGHWAFQPIRNPVLPGKNPANWCQNEIDFFVARQLQQRSVDPSPRAEKATLIKRLYYDLVGLPPTPEAVDRFVQSDDPGALEAIVDQLLASRHFGERWARHWLDKARYADSDGYEKDRPRPNAWRYRDWVIEAIQSDMPFDQFTIEQLAGDRIPDATPMQRLATAFHRQTLTNTEGGTDQEQFRVEATFDRTETVSAIWMGLTMTCARCHTHKYDQITQTEYYQLYSFFNNANETSAQVPTSLEAEQRYQQELAAQQQRVKDLEKRFEQQRRTIDADVEAWIQTTRRQLASAEPPRFHPLKMYRSKLPEGISLQAGADGSQLVQGPVPDQSKYTLFFDSPGRQLTGFKIEVLTDKTLPAQGPGRAPNGNFVLSQVRAYRAQDADFKKHERLEFASADADFSQSKFSPAGALSDQAKSGWAVAPQMGKPHQITLFLKRPVAFSKEHFLQVVLDQSYGGKHTIGKFRVTAMTGLDPARSLPAEIVKALKQPQQDARVLETISRFVAKTHPQTAPLWKELQAARQATPKPARLSVRVLGPATRKTRLLHRGDFLQPKDEIQTGVLQLISSTHPLEKKTASLTRMDLARWLVDPAHPLTARVTVNHTWAQLFGRGIVATQNDFGVRGEPPTHPDLLDWLAYQFSHSMKWSRKALIKKIVLSSTYQQASVHRAQLSQRDPTNRWLARQNRVRVPAEIVRDLTLAASGLLSQKVGGPSVFPPLPSGVTDLSYANNFKWKTSGGEDRYRRGLYTFFKRTSPHPNLTSFDCPDSNTTRIQRDQSNTPIQALITLNNEVYFESAQALARRLFQSPRETDSERLRRALRLCIAREPSASEVHRFEKLLQRNRVFYRENPELAGKLTQRHRVDKIAPAENAAWVATTRMILNLDELIVRD